MSFLSAIIEAERSSLDAPIAPSVFIALTSVIAPTAHTPIASTPVISISYL